MIGLGDLRPEEFLEQYWQRRPLLIRQAAPGFRSPLSADELAGLALEAGVESRLVREQPRGHYSLAHGPFEQETFSSLGDKDWTLLVQDVDKLLPEVGALLRDFSFLPRWRLDDIMISFAAPGGSVGPHFDRYDVFLLQVEGERRWQFGKEALTDYALDETQDLKILAGFSPEEDHVLKPGDMLYLPPGVAHHGVAVTPCLTFSIGFRAPDYGDLLQNLTQAALSLQPEDDLYSDAGRTPAPQAGQLAAEDLEKIVAGVRERLQQLVNSLQSLGADENILRQIIGQQLSRPKEHLLPEDFDGEEISLPGLRQGTRLACAPSTILIYHGDDGGLEAFANGNGLTVPPAAAALCRQLADHGEATLTAAPSADVANWLEALVARGLLEIA